MFSWLHALRRAAIYYVEQKDLDADSPKEKVASAAIAYGKMSKPIKEGHVTVQSTLGLFGSLVWSKKFVVLADNTMFFFKKQPSDNDSAEFAVALDNGSCDISDYSDKIKKNKSVLAIIRPSRLYFVSCGTAQELQEWLQAVSQLIDKCMVRTVYSFQVRDARNANAKKEPSKK